MSSPRLRTRIRYLASSLHLFVFTLTWVMYGIFPQPLMDGPAKWPFGVLMVADLPLSVLFFGFLFRGNTISALLSWAVLGTAWWYLLGMGLERLFAQSKGERKL